MKHITTERRTIHRVTLLAGVTALALALPFTIARAGALHDERIQPPRVPGKLEVPRGNEVVDVGHAEGTQNYSCLPSANGVAWALFTPQATLFSDRGRQLLTHFFSPNPIENSTVRAAWQDSRDASTFWGKVTEISTDAAFVRRGAIPWLLIEKAGVQEGPADGDNVTHTTFIQRVHTDGGAAPTTGCAVPTDIGKQAFVPYTADYFFYEPDSHPGHR